MKTLLSELIGAKDSIDCMSFLDHPKRPSSTRPEHARKAFFKVFFKTLEDMPEGDDKLMEIAKDERKLLSHYNQKSWNFELEKKVLSNPILRVKFLKAMRLNMQNWISRFKSQNKQAFELFGRSIIEHAKRLELKEVVLAAKSEITLKFEPVVLPPIKSLMI